VIKRPTLRRKLLLWLASYLLLLTGVLFSAAYYVHEQAEHAVWEALLTSELDSIIEQIHSDPHYRWQDSETMRLFRASDHRILPETLAMLPEGLHDDVEINDIQHAVIVRIDEDLGPVALALDITDFEELENFITRWASIAGVAMFIISLLMAWVGMNRLVHPLSKLATSIAHLQPQRSGQQVQVSAGGSAELEVIAAAVNAYIQRNERFVKRELAFISTASHELRTPIATIAGATELALKQPDLSARTRQQLQRIDTTVSGVEQLIHLLLILARDPARLAARSEPLALEQLLPDIVGNHLYLADGKELEVKIATLHTCRVLAPEGIVQIAVGNLLRNAIENSDRGVISLSLSSSAVVIIDDPGHGMKPEEVASIYARMSRNQAHTGSHQGDGNGIGLDLITRLCEHLGWHLEIDCQRQRGTRVILDMSASLLLPLDIN